jgi:hypothetical protein
MYGILLCTLFKKKAPLADLSACGRLRLKIHLCNFNQGLYSEKTLVQNTTSCLACLDLIYLKGGNCQEFLAGDPDFLGIPLSLNVIWWRSGMMECWNSGIMGIKTGGYKPNIPSFQYSNWYPSWDKAPELLYNQ